MKSVPVPDLRGDYTRAAVDYSMEQDFFQEAYFVIDSFYQLMRETAPDFTPLYARLRDQAHGI